MPSRRLSRTPPRSRSPWTSRRRASPRSRATRRERRVPVRTCVGCGRRAPQSELRRFAAVDGVLTQGRNLPGRGAYTCDRLECFEQALALRAFRRGLRANVTVGPDLVRIYTERSDG